MLSPLQTTPADWRHKKICLDRRFFANFHFTVLDEANGEPEPIDGFTAAQRFYISYATIWGQNIRDEEAARLTKVDVHSLGKNRVNATLRNIATFYEAFDITDGAMFLPEEERVVIW